MKREFFHATTFANLCMAAVVSSGVYAAEKAEADKAKASKPKDEPKGECHGINACKGKGECGGPGWDCAGNNTCKGQGWLSMTKSECTKKGGKFKA